MATESVILH